MISRHAYEGQLTQLGERVIPLNHRYEILPTDFSRLYRQHNKESYGIDINIRPEQNVDNWLDPSSAHFKPDVYRAVFRYAARATEDERLKLCIATEEMQEASWKYCHKSQLVLDGTFGVCSSRLLLWIALAVDERHHGIPIAMFLFSAPTGNRATHAGYNTAIIRELLASWKTWLTEHKPFTVTEPFSPYMAITDTDTKERAALVAVWPDIILTLCGFHVRQCWTNKRTSLLRKDESAWAVHVEKRLHTLERR